MVKSQNVYSIFFKTNQISNPDCFQSIEKSSWLLIWFPFEENEKILKIPSDIFSPLWCEEYLGLKATDFAPGKTLLTHTHRMIN